MAAPFFILVALAPAIARLCRAGRASLLAGKVIAWYLMTSIVAGIVSVCFSAVLFNIPFTSSKSGMLEDVSELLRSTFSQAGASWPILAILLAFFAGIAGAKWDRGYQVLTKIHTVFVSSSRSMYYVLVPFVFCLGISIGIRFGVSIGMTTYFKLTLYTAVLCLLWSAIYVFVVLKFLAREPIRQVLARYYFPVAAVAAGTCSSIATLPFNLETSRRYGVSPEISSFVIPFGSVINMDASVIAYIAYAPFILTQVFDYPISWTALLIAWPAIVVFTISAPGLPAGMGTALWSATLFSSLLGLKDEAQIEFVETWIALSGGIPDMLRTATNCTSDGFTAILFNRWDIESTAAPATTASPLTGEVNA